MPNIDLGATIHMSRDPNIDWKNKLNGNATDYGGSLSLIGVTVGGNQGSSDFWDGIMDDYGSVSIMLNLGPNDFIGGVNKNTTNQKYLFSLPKWLGAPW